VPYPEVDANVRVVNGVAEGILDLRTSLPTTGSPVSLMMAALARQCLDPTPQRRPSATQLVIALTNPDGVSIPAAAVAAIEIEIALPSAAVVEEGLSAAVAQTQQLEEEVARLKQEKITAERALRQQETTVQIADLARHEVEQRRAEETARLALDTIRLADEARVANEQYRVEEKFHMKAQVQLAQEQVHLTEKSSAEKAVAAVCLHVLFRFFFLLLFFCECLKHINHVICICVDLCVFLSLAALCCSRHHHRCPRCRHLCRAESYQCERLERIDHRFDPYRFGPKSLCVSWLLSRAFRCRQKIASTTK
jgi:hypothetical protein